jgi:selenocysteine-specific translation elongation factor
MTREHIGCATALKIPLLVAITKIDLAPPEIAAATRESVTRVIKLARRVPFPIRSDADVAIAAATLSADRIVPVVEVSNTTGEGLERLRALLAALPPRAPRPLGVAAAQQPTNLGAGDPAASAPGGPAAAPASDPAEALTPNDIAALGPPSAVSARAVAATDEESGPPRVCIDTIYSVPGVGTVVAGMVIGGAISVSTPLLLGPDASGGWTPVSCRSIQVHFVSVETAGPGITAAFAIRARGRATLSTSARAGGTLARGMILVAAPPEAPPRALRSFVAEILVLHHATSIRSGATFVAHIGVVRMTVRVAAIADLDTGAPLPLLRTGARALVTMAIAARPAWFPVGELLLLREGRTRCVGRVVAAREDCPPVPTRSIRGSLAAREAAEREAADMAWESAAASGGAGGAGRGAAGAVGGGGGGGAAAGAAAAAAADSRASRGSAGSAPTPPAQSARRGGRAA